MRNYLVALLLLVFTGWAANLKLYLKDGSYHVVREYQVQSDRVHYYSVERSQWEDIPLDLVDLKRTEAEVAERQAQLDKDAQAVAEEEKVERDLARETSRIPQDPGVYWLEGNQARVLKVAQSTIHTNKGRAILKALSPIPMVPGKGTLELSGAHSANVFTNPEQEFYIQLAETERFGIARLTSKGAVRIVENLTFVPVTKEVIEEPTMVETFQKQLADDLYKIWPKQPLEPGEYAVIEYTEGKLNIQIWDFAVQPAK
ncbi:MAG: hypothetical protein ABSH44_24035 [Bryobacteraceae bacterium]|jgi:hypothetical protein